MRIYGWLTVKTVTVETGTFSSLLALGIYCRVCLTAILCHRCGFNSAFTPCIVWCDSRQAVMEWCHLKVFFILPPALFRLCFRPRTGWKLKDGHDNSFPCDATETDWQRVTYGGIEAQVTDVTGDDGLLLWCSHTKGVVYHCLLHWVQLQDTHMQTRHRANWFNTLLMQLVNVTFTNTLIFYLTVFHSFN